MTIFLSIMYSRFTLFANGRISFLFRLKKNSGYFVFVCVYYVYVYIHTLCVCHNSVTQLCPTLGYSSVLAWRIHGHRKLAGYSPWDRKNHTQTQSDTNIQHAGQRWRWGHRPPSLGSVSFLSWPISLLLLLLLLCCFSRVRL